MHPHHRRKRRWLSSEPCHEACRGDNATTLRRAQLPNEPTSGRADDAVAHCVLSNAVPSNAAPSNAAPSNAAPSNERRAVERTPRRRTCGSLRRPRRGVRRTRCAVERCAVERERCAGGVAHCVPSNAAPSNVWNAAPSPGCGQPTRQGGGNGLSLSGGGNAAQRWGQWMKFLMVEATPLWAVWWSGDAALGSIATSTCTVAFDWLWLWVAVCPVAARGCVPSAVGLHRTRVAHCVPSNAVPSNVWITAPSPGMLRRPHRGVNCPP